MIILPQDESFMRVALSLARRQLGATWPNPSVSALVVKDGAIIGQGITARGGRPHAEPQALGQAGEAARGATLYVTLEPCGHRGQTSPCADAVIEAGIARCVVACPDPNPLVSGGLARLCEAGIAVTENVCRAEAEAVNEGFFSVIRQGRPLVSLKLATSRDGRMAPRAGQPRWITGPRARAFGHLLRARHDAIATGIGTVLADDPELTCRLPGLEHRSPVRVVFSRTGRLPATSRLALSADAVPVWLCCHPEAQPKDFPSDVQILRCAQDDVEDALALLARQGITRLLVEGGPTLSAAFLAAGLADRIYWFQSPDILGGPPHEALAGQLHRLAGWHRVGRRHFEPDSLSVLQCSPAS